MEYKEEFRSVCAARHREVGMGPAHIRYYKNRQAAEAAIEVQNNPSSPFSQKWCVPYHLEIRRVSKWATE